MADIALETNASIQRNNKEKTSVSEKEDVAGKFKKEDVIDYLYGIINTEWENVAKIWGIISQQFSGFDVKQRGYRNVTDFLNRSGRFETRVVKKDSSSAGVAYVRRK